MTPFSLPAHDNTHGNVRRSPPTNQKTPRAQSLVSYPYKREKYSALFKLQHWTAQKAQHCAPSQQKENVTQLGFLAVFER